MQDREAMQGSGETLKFRCPNCNFVYDESRGCPREGYPAGTRWATLPDDFACPDCAVRDKPDFVQTT